MTLSRPYLELRELRSLQWGIGLHLLDGPRTLEQLQASCENNPFPYANASGAFTTGIWRERHLGRLRDDLARLVQAGWVVEEQGYYALTPLGCQKVNGAMRHALIVLHGLSSDLRALVRPATASKVTLVVQVLLAAIKLPAGLLSGSVGLLNDALDTLLDLLSSLLVYLGVRFDRERLVSILLVASMLATGGFTLYEAVRRFFVPYVPVVDWFPFAAALLSAAAGLFLWTYERYVGLHSGLMSFIAESVDSRNHVFVALGVTAGLLGALMRFGWLDMLVGLVVAGLILWSALELLRDLVHSSADGHLDLSRYGFWPLHAFEAALQQHVDHAILQWVGGGEAHDKVALLDRIEHATNFRDNPWFQALGLDRPLLPRAVAEKSLSQLIRRGWVMDQAPLALSAAGQAELAMDHERPIRRA